MHKRLFTLLLVFVSLSCLASEINIPKLTGRVNDYANIISSNNESFLDSLLKQNEDSTTNQIVILTVPSLQNFSIDYFSISVAESWKLGTKENDNGVLILIAPNERKVRIEVGDGLQGNLTDALSKRIIQNYFIPYFKKSDYETGILKGTTEILLATHNSYVNEIDEEKQDNGLGFWGKILVGGLFGSVVTCFLILFAIPAVIEESTGGKIFTILWYGIFCFALAILIHWFFIVLFIGYFTFIVLSFLLPIRKELLNYKWVQKLSGAKKSKSGDWYIPKSSSSSYGGSSSSGGSSYSGGGGSFSGGGSSGSW